MEAIHILAFILTASISANVSATPDPKSPPEPRDVNVVSTPNVTVTNPQTSVTVSNEVANPVPLVGTVIVDNTSEIPVTVNDSNCESKYEFVGFSSTLHLSNEGLFAFNCACQTDYDINSRMCTSDEFIDMPHHPAVPKFSSAWIRPGYKPLGISPTSCDGWMERTGTGLVVLWTGAVTNGNCSVKAGRHVACCSPIP